MQKQGIMQTIESATPTYPSSYPLATLVERPSLWMLEILADLYEAEIRGTHGLHIVHPRASWLTLVVSSVTTCGACGGPARWEERSDDGERVAWCGRCAEAEVALAAARALRWPARRAPAGDLTRTVRVPAITMHAMVYGARALAILALAFGLGSVGCATAPRPIEVEAVGQLDASPTHVTQAAVHADTDLSGGFQAVEGDDSATKTVTTVSAVDAAPTVETKVAHGF